MAAAWVSRRREVDGGMTSDMASDTELQDSGTGVAAVPPQARLLLRTVYIMGIVLVLLLIALVAGIVWKAAHRAPAAMPAAPAAFDLGLPADEAIVAVAASGDRLVVTTSRGIVIVDLKRNAVSARIAPRPQ